MPVSRRRLYVIIALFAGLAVVGGLFGGFLTTAPLDYDPTTTVLSTEGPLFILGYWNDPSVADEKQLLDAPQYITSWKPTGNSEGPVPIANLVTVGGYFRNARWNYYVSGGLGWTLVKSTPAQSPATLGGVVVIPPPNPLYYFIGEINGWLRVEFAGEWWGPGPNLFDGDALFDLRASDRAWIRDDATLVSGRGSIVEPKELSRWSSGQVIRVTLDLGSACSAKVSDEGAISKVNGYTLEIFSEAQGQTVKTWKIGCGPGATSKDISGNPLEYAVTSADFSQAGECKNRLIFKLYNDLFLKDQTDVKTVDLSAGTLPKPGVEFSVEGDRWEEGKMVTVNVLTDQTGVTVNLIVENIETGVRVLAVDGGTELTYEFVPNVAGTYRGTVSIEQNCAVSEPAEFTLVIREGEPPDWRGGGGFVIGLWVWLAVAGGVSLLIGILVPMRRLYRIIAILLAIVFFLSAALVFPG